MAVNGSQNEVLVVRKINVDYQGFVIGYDVEIKLAVSFVNNYAMFYEEGNSTSSPSLTIIFYCIIALNFEIHFPGKERLV